jgi:hypothetical protein
MRNNIIIAVSIVFFSIRLSATTLNSEITVPRIINDTLPGKELLYNGRIWRDIYVSVREDQFLLTKDFLPGTVKFNNNVYKGLKVRYDIFLDEVHIITENGKILQLNKEMTDEFSLTYYSRIYKFQKLYFNDYPDLTGYADMRYQGKTLLFVKHKKEISKISPGKSYENFVQSDFVYAVSDNIPHRIKRRHDLMEFLGDKKDQVISYMKQNRIKVNVKMPDTIIPVLEYFDSLER